VILSSSAPYPINVIFGFTSYPSNILKTMCEMWSCDKFYSLKAGGMESSEKEKNKWVEKSYTLGLRDGDEEK
jgi:hypothetical protein